MLDPLTLDQLRVAVAVADTGSFSAAARKLQRVQSAVSQSVQALEATLRLPLFDRTEKRPRPTEAGLIVLGDARRLIDGAGALRARAESMTRGLEPELTIATDQLLPRGPAMRTLRALSREFPHLPVRLLNEGVGAPARHLRAGIAQVAIFSVEIQGGPDLEAEFLTQVEMVPVVAATHPLAALPGPLSREVLAEHTQLVLTDVSSPSGFSRGVVSHDIWRFADMNTRLSFLLEGFGWCNMPLHLVAPHLASGALRRLSLREQDGFSVALHVVHRRGRTPGVAGRWVIDRLRRELEEEEMEGGAPEPGDPAAAPAVRAARQAPAAARKACPTRV